MIDARTLLRIYVAGAFPMWDAAEDAIHLFRPDPRAIIELDGLHVPRRLARTIRRRPFRITTDRAFDLVLEECHRDRDDGCWCSPAMAAAYGTLHRQGHAHSVEAWRDEELVGGLYGVHLGSAFMAESMFSRPERGGTDASKIVLVRTVQRLRLAGFRLFDVQFENEHIAQFGVIPIPGIDYQRRFEASSTVRCDWPVIDEPGGSRRDQDPGGNASSTGPR